MLFLLLSSNSLQIISKTNQVVLQFPQEVIRHQEVIDKKAFEKLIQDFFSRVPKQEVGVFLDSPLVYQKTVHTKEMTETTEEDFFATIPFPPERTANLVIQNKADRLFLSTNKDFFESLTNLLIQHGWPVRFVVPLTIFAPIIQTSPITFPLLNKLMKQKNLLTKANFLIKEHPSEAKNIPWKQIIIVMIMIAWLVGIGVFAAYMLHLFPTHESPSKPSATIKQLPVVTKLPSSPTPTLVQASPSAALVKKDIKIQILNGSGSPGEATLLKNRLDALGFSSIETGNTEGATSNTTIVIFSKRVPSEFKDSILTELKTMFNTVETQQIASSDLYDVFITTGGL